jgi:hypothetical protein
MLRGTGVVKRDGEFRCIRVFGLVLTLKPLTHMVFLMSDSEHMPMLENIECIKWSNSVLDGTYGLECSTQGCTIQNVTMNILRQRRKGL